MNYQEFRCEFLERMKEVMEEGVNYHRKNPKMSLWKAFIEKRECQGFSIEDYFSYWERGVPLEQLVRKVMWQFEHCKPQMDVEADFFKIIRKSKKTSVLN